MEITALLAFSVRRASTLMNVSTQTAHINVDGVRPPTSRDPRVESHSWVANPFSIPLFVIIYCSLATYDGGAPNGQE
jgi:hypothetical protein